MKVELPEELIGDALGDPIDTVGRTVSLTTEPDARAVFPAASEWPAVTLIAPPSETPLTFMDDAVKLPPVQDGLAYGVPLTLTTTSRPLSEQVPDTE